jgi:hypothetical protein
VLVVNVHPCLPGPSKPVRVVVYLVGGGYPPGSINFTANGYGPFAWELQSGQYRIISIGPPRTVTVAPGVVNQQSFGVTHVCPVL